MVERLSRELARKRHLHSVVMDKIPACRQDAYLRDWQKRAARAVELAARGQWENAGRLIESLRLKEEWVHEIAARFRLCPGLSREATAWRVARIQEGEERSRVARNALVEGNLRLVFPFARAFIGFPGIDGMDLIQEGNRGLLRAAEKWDWSRGIRYGQYAAWWIRMHLGRAVDEWLYAVKLPAPVVAQMRRARASLDAVALSAGQEVVSEVVRKTGLSRDQAAGLLDLPHHAISLDQPVSLDEGISFAGLLVDEGMGPEAMAEGESRSRLLARILALLPRRERICLTLWYGLDGRGERTLVQIGERFGVSMERARQIREEALERIREMRESGKLREIK